MNNISARTGRKSGMEELALLIILILLIIFFSTPRTVREHYPTYETGGLALPSRDAVALSTSGIPGVSRGLERNDISHFTGVWIYKSSDGLREEVLTTEFVDPVFLKIHGSVKITPWYPPLHDTWGLSPSGTHEGGKIPPITVRPERYEETLPPMRILVLGANEIMLISSNPTYAYMPSRMIVDPPNGTLEFRGKKYISTLRMRSYSKAPVPSKVHPSSMSEV